jgi:hypothetical protein
MTASSPAENGGSEPTPAPTKQAGCKSVSENGLTSPVDDATTAADDAQGGNSNHPSENQNAQASTAPVVSASKRSRPPYKYDPHKITLRFLFANRDGLTVTVECNPTDTVGEVKGALLSVWPEGMRYGCFKILAMYWSARFTRSIDRTNIDSLHLRSSRLFWCQSVKTNMHG